MLKIILAKTMIKMTMNKQRKNKENKLNKKCNKHLWIHLQQNKEIQMINSMLLPYLQLINQIIQKKNNSLLQLPRIKEKHKND